MTILEYTSCIMSLYHEPDISEVNLTIISITIISPFKSPTTFEDAPHFTIAES